MKIKLAISLIGLFLISYLTGMFQFWVLGDITPRMTIVYPYQEDSKEMAELIKTRWTIVHAINQF